nr:hypothetical protein [Tanacetum cinerariifolium]
MKRFKENTDRNLKRHDSAIKGLEKKIKQLVQAVHSSMVDDLKSVNQVKTVVTKSSMNTHYSDSLDSNTALCTTVISNLVEKEIVVKACKREETLKSMPIIGTFSYKVKMFIFLVDFVILDLVEDDKVSIILGRPMLTTAHAGIDVFVKNISLEVEGENFREQENLEEFLMNDEINGDLGDFLELNDLFLRIDVEPFGGLSYSESEMEIRLDDFS